MKAGAKKYKKGKKGEGVKRRHHTRLSY